MPTNASLHYATSGEAVTDERFSVRLVESAVFIMVQGVQVNDEGSYVITASNMFGSDSQNFIIETKGELGRGGGEGLNERMVVDGRERNHRG